MKTIQIASPLARKGTRRGGFYSNFAVPDNVLGFWLLNRASADTTEAVDICSRNRLLGAARDPLDRVVVGTPTVNDDYWRFPSGCGIRTRIAEPDDVTIYAIARCADTGVGSTSADRAAVAGWFGNTANKGTCFQFHTMSTLRAIAYNGTPAIQTQDLTVPTDTIGKWRLYRLRALDGAPGSFGLLNATGDSVTDEPSAVSLTTAKTPGLQKFAIGDRFEGTTPSASNTKHVDISAILLVGQTHDTGEQDDTLAQLRLQLGLTALTEGAV